MISPLDMLQSAESQAVPWVPPPGPAHHRGTARPRTALVDVHHNPDLSRAVARRVTSVVRTDETTAYATVLLWRGVAF